MSALINSVEHALAAAASDTVKAAKFVETSVLPVLKKVQADASTIEGRDGSRHPPVGQHWRAYSRCLVWSSMPSTLPELRLVQTAST